MEKIKVLEIGTSSLLDFPYDTDKFHFGKLVHINEPYYFDELFYGGLGRYQYNFSKYDIAVFSQGCIFRNHSSEFHELTFQEIQESITVNLVNIMSQVSFILKNCNTINKFLILGSIAGEGIYPSRIPYSVAKAGLIKFAENLSIAYPNKEFRILNLEGYKTKINNFNSSYKDPSEGFYLITKTILEMTNDNKTN